MKSVCQSWLGAVVLSLNSVIWVMVSVNLIKRTWAIRTHSIMLVPHGSRLCGSYFHHFAMTEFTSVQQ